MVLVAQLVRASDCGSEGRGFESHLAPHKIKEIRLLVSFLLFHENTIGREFPASRLVNICHLAEVSSSTL